jgi:hypothetical protein
MDIWSGRPYPPPRCLATTVHRGRAVAVPGSTGATVSTATEPQTTFAAAVGCIDGRIHPALTRYVAAAHGVDAVDLVTEPGVDGALAAGDGAILRDVLRRLAPSRDAHACRGVVVAGHEDCAAMPGDLDAHRAAVACAARRLADELGGTPVEGVLVLLDGSVEVVEAATSCA